MYLPAHFEETDPAEVSALIVAFPLAAVIVKTSEGLVANHIPLMFENERTLVGHIAIANDLHGAVADGEEVLAIFRGDDAYVSPNWYPSKPEHHRHVPTWNYQVVHVHGSVHFHHDHKFKLSVVGRLTKRHETATNGAGAWKMADAPKDYIEAMLDGIVGFQIDIGRVVAKSKLSQNRDAGDFANVTRVMEDRGHAGLAARMRKTNR